MTNTRLPLRILLGSIAVSCLLLIAAILVEDIGDTTGNLIGTAMTIAMASLFTMASIHAWNHPRGRGVARACVVATGFAALGLIATIWTHRPDELSLQLMGTAVTFAIGFAHLVVMAQCRLAPRYQWGWVAIVGCDVLVIVFVLASIWGSQPAPEAMRLLAVLVVLASGLTIAMMVFHLLSRQPATAARDGHADVCFCPACGKSLWFAAGDVRCHHCDRAFHIELRDAAVPPLATARINDANASSSI